MEDDYSLEFGLIPEGRDGERTSNAPVATPIITPRYILKDLTPEQLLLIQQGYLDVGGGMLTNNNDIPPESDTSRIRDDRGNIAEIFRNIFDQMGRTDLLETGGELLEILAETTRAGQPSAPPPEDVLRGLTPEQRAAVMQAILIYNQQLDGDTPAEPEPEGPPEELPTELEEEVDIDADTTLEDEIGVEPDMPIDIPFPDLPPREEGEGDGEGAGESNGNGGGEQQETAQGEGDEEEYQFPDYPQGDPNYGYPDGLPGGGRGGTIYDVPVQEEPGFTVGIGVPVLGSIASGGGDGGNGGGGGGGQPRGMLDSRFNPYMASIGYTPVAVPKLILPQAPIVSSLFSEFLS